MMKRLAVLTLMLCAALAFVVAPASATDPASGVFSMAQYVPSQAAVFWGARIDDDHFAAVDGVLAQFESTLADMTGQPQDLPDTLGILAQITDFEREDIQEALDYAGDYMAVALLQPGGDLSQMFLAVSLTDRAALEARFVDDPGSEFIPQGEFGRYSVYLNGDGEGAAAFLFADDVMLVFNSSVLGYTIIAGEDYTRLADDADFTGTIGALTADSYNLALYVTPETVAQNAELAQFIQSPVAIGGTILDSTTLTLDATFFGGGMGMTGVPVDPAFAASIPGDAGAVIHGGNIQFAIEALNRISQTLGGGDLVAELNNGLAGAELSLDDLYAWAGGDFALYARADFLTIIPQLMADTPDLSGFGESFDLGAVIEVTDPAAARAFTDRLRDVIYENLGEIENVTVADEDINGVTLTTVTVDIPIQSATYSLKVAVGVSDTLFALGSYRAVSGVFSGAPGLDQNAAYQDSAAYWLASPTSVWWVDDETVANVALLNGLILFGRAGMSGAGVDTPENVQNAADAITGLLRHATITSATGAGDSPLFRATISLENQ